LHHLVVVRLQRQVAALGIVLGESSFLQASGYTVTGYLPTGDWCLCTKRDSAMPTMLTSINDNVVGSATTTMALAIWRSTALAEFS